MLQIKVADYGSCRGIYSKPPYTEYISTRWYRAPECLLTDGYYDYKMDLWGIGCVFFEVVALFPLFPGSNELDQIEKIHAVMGTPSKELQLKFKRYDVFLRARYFPEIFSNFSKFLGKNLSPQNLTSFAPFHSDHVPLL